MKMALLSLYQPNYQRLADVVLPNWKRYCMAQGYDLRVFCGTFGTHPIGFQKLQYLYDQMFTKNLMDLAWVIDLDILITNQTVRFERFVSDSHDWYVCEEPWAKINHGSFIIKKTDNSRRIIESILMKMGQWGDEQTVMNMEYRDKGLLAQNRIKVLPHPSINSFLCRFYLEDKHAWRTLAANWFKGHFVLHLIAMSLEQRLKVFQDKDIQDQIIYAGREPVISSVFS